MLGHIIREANSEPTRQATFRGRNIRPNYPRKKRVGRPRQKWTIETMKRTWDALRKEDKKAPETFQVNNKKHRTYIQGAAVTRRF